MPFRTQQQPECLHRWKTAHNLNINAHFDEMFCYAVYDKKRLTPDRLAWIKLQVKAG